MSACRGYNDRQWNAVFVCQDVPFCAQFAPVCGIVSGHRPPKGDFMDMESSDCQAQLIPIMLS